MKPRLYLMMLIVLIPLQATLLGPLSLAGVKPDLPLALIYIIGLLTGPTEGAIAGMGIGLLQDVASASMLGVSGFTRGLVGLMAGVLGTRVLDIASPSNVLFLTAFSLVENIIIAVFVQTLYGDLPFVTVFFTRMLPGALYTAVLGTLMLRFMNQKDRTSTVLRRSLVKE